MLVFNIINIINFIIFFIWKVHLKILTGKKHPQIKLKFLQKEVLKMQSDFQKNKEVIGKLRCFWKLHFVFLIIFVLTSVFDKAVLYGNVAFSILVLSSKKQHARFF